MYLWNYFLFGKFVGITKLSFFVDLLGLHAKEVAKVDERSGGGIERFLNSLLPKISKKIYITTRISQRIPLILRAG